MKWDIIVNSSSAMLYVADLHLSPISHNIPYTPKSDEKLLNNTHQDNVKAYYKEIKSNFYNEAINAEYTHNWPIITNKDEIIDCYSNTYDMGCRRMRSYDLYKKQFEFLCPLWIEKLDGDIKFEISVKNIDSNTILSRNSLVLKTNGVASHDKFVNYFNDYLYDAGLIAGNDDLINVKFKNSTANITGLNVSNGLFETKNIDSLVGNLSIIERPLMETDNLIIKSFANNTLVAKQLLNFNLCFNIEDILTGSIVIMMSGRKISIAVNVYMGDKLLEKKDFYTDYEFIKKEIISNNPLLKEEINVLDYLHDYEAIDLIDKNKFSQNICHWSLCDNNEYIFNVYEGFSGMYIEEIIDKDGNKILNYHENEHQYGIAPNTIIKKANKNQNTTGWINYVEIMYWNEFYKYIGATDSMKSSATFVKDKYYINNIKYSNIPDFGEDGMYLIGMHVTEDIMTTISEIHYNFGLDSFDKLYNNLYILKKSNLMMLISTEADNLTFSLMKDIFFKCSLNNFDGISVEGVKNIKLLYELMCCKIDPEIVVFNSGLLWQPVESPSKESKEITYYKDTHSQNFVMRYDGKIKPTFTVNSNKKFVNAIYIKDYISNIEKSKYSSYLNTKYEPLYPSINYFTINKLNKWSYDVCPNTHIKENNTKNLIYKNPEYSWFNNGIMIILVPEIRYSYINSKQENGSYKDVKEIVKEYLHKFFDIEDFKTIDYILSRYNIINDWDYVSDKNVDDYKYNITLKLK